jgi:hypothetical protein
MSIEFVGELRRLDVKPGDRFVITTSDVLSMAQAKLVQAQWKEFIGGSVPLLILTSGMQIGVIRDESEAG